MKKYFNKIHYSKNLDFKDKLFKSILAFFSVCYLIGVSLKNFLYSKNILKKVKLSAYVISVGNLTTGGTGKTPITIEIAKYIKDKSHKKVAVLSRGYGGKLSGNEVNVVSDGENILLSPYLAGEEPYLIASKLKGVIVLTGKNRVKLGEYAINNFGAEVLILDDGFQHIKLARDLDILVIDSHKKFGNGMLLPAGPLREHASQIKRADKIILANKKAGNKKLDSTINEFATNLKDKFGKNVCLCNFKTAGIYNITNSEAMNYCANIYAFAGIAQPEFFFNYLREQKLNIVAVKEFSDHYLYTEYDLKIIFNEAKKLGAEAIITTEKDGVKIQSILNKIKPELPVYVLKLELDLDIRNILDLKFNRFIF